MMMMKSNTQLKRESNNDVQRRDEFHDENHLLQLIGASIVRPTAFVRPKEVSLEIPFVDFSRVIRNRLTVFAKRGKKTTNL